MATTALLTPCDLTDPTYLFVSPTPVLSEPLYEVHLGVPTPQPLCEWCEAPMGLLTWHVMVDPDWDECCDVCTTCAANAGFAQERMTHLAKAVTVD